MSHYFFVSYSRSDQLHRVGQFYADLVREVRAAAGVPAATPDNEIGF